MMDNGIWRLEQKESRQVGTNGVCHGVALDPGISLRENRDDKKRGRAKGVVSQQTENWIPGQARDDKKIGALSASVGMTGEGRDSRQARMTIW